LIDPGIVATTRSVESDLVQQLNLSPIPIDSRLATAIGTFREAPVTIETSAYRNERIRLARFSVVYGETLQIGNILCIPEPDYVVPILGADLVSVRSDSMMIAADLSPVSSDPGRHKEQMAELARARAECEPVPPGGELPEWAQQLFSPHALYTRIAPSQAEKAFKALRIFPRTFAKLMNIAHPEPGTASAIAAAQSHYSDVHRADDKGLRLLAAMFGMEWAERYLEKILFPSSGEIV
jgi:phycocyanobilin:ferredoxin oxidoreductase